MLRKILCDLRDISFPQFFVFDERGLFSTQTLKAMKVLSGKKMRGPRKM